MKRVEVWKSDHGTYETDLDRAKAYDLVAGLNQALRDKHTYGQTPKSRIDLSEALELVENAPLVIAHLQEYLKLKDEADAEKAAEDRFRESQLPLAIGTDSAGEAP
ncbi:MAG: hypothetical protein DI533_20200 [Cereibacter sphaeroides]|uniref:Uncharacterized protein n=1 Tax=Cereibacter sphaeroides TaxID=1063 RepID=A0A2W5S7Y4_CERSP|nr:MAG: hypothetical protein DI533_20200 [Cereibacter sphaeroides]